MKEAFDPTPRIVEDLSFPAAGVRAVARLLSEGATVPFIARYRKEATGGLDEVAIRSIAERSAYLTELESRRTAVLAEIREQGKLTDALSRAILACRTKADLEDLYRPFKPKRRTRATVARERGLEPLAALMWSQDEKRDPADASVAFVDPSRDVPDTEAALSGARDICAERLAEDAGVRKRLRESYLRDGVIRAAKKKTFRSQKTKFDVYADYEEPLRAIPSHRYLAIRRGESEKVLRVALHLDLSPHRAFIEQRVPLRRGTSWRKHLSLAIDDAVERLIRPAVEADASAELKARSDVSAVEVFAKNLREILLAAPFGSKAVIGIDPGQRTGCKCAVVDETGRLLAHATIYLVQGEGALAKASDTLRALCRRHAVRAIAVGNGTHGRETEAFVRDVLKAEGLDPSRVPCVSVSESGASVYSASDVAREELPELDLTVRGAVSIARRLQDPLAELVKVDPKSIGVGQYQHDVSQTLLARKLDEVVESCVNAVGVDVNTASVLLLSRVAGVGPSLARKIVSHRDARGPFQSREAFHDVPGLGPKAFEQAAGFLRVPVGPEPLDASAVHPERYALVARMARDLDCPVAKLIGNGSLLKQLKLRSYETVDVGSFTLTDIIRELEKPGRDPRASFEPPRFRDDVRSLEDLKVGMKLEGVVTNVTAFGAFVDIGVHQDGLVHVSQLADRFVEDPAEVVKAGDKLEVRVLDVDLARKRIALTRRRDEGAGAGGRAPEDTGGGPPPDPTGSAAPSNNAAPPRSFGNNPFEQHFKK